MAQLSITGLGDLMVPLSFDYEEISAGTSEEASFFSLRTKMSSQEGSVVALDVPTNQIEVTSGFKMVQPGMRGIGVEPYN